MKELKLNQDSTLNILDERKYYVAKLIWNDDHRQHFWECLHDNLYLRSMYRFIKIGGMTELSVWDDVCFQNSCLRCIHTMNESTRYYQGTLYQFENKQEFIKARSEGLI